MSYSEYITGIFTDLAEKLAGGLSDLLGCSIEVTLAGERRIPKENLLPLWRGKMVMAHFSVSGSREGEMQCFCHLKDAVLLGGTLIMLPPAELEKKVRNEEFTEEEADAYGEIVNIVSGELCQVFDLGASDKLHFKKTGIEVLQPAKVDPGSEKPFPPGDYYQVSYTLVMDEQPLKNLEMVFPPALLGMPEEEAAVPPAAVEAPVAQAPAEQAPAQPAPVAGSGTPAEAQGAEPMVLVVTGPRDEVHAFTDACKAEGFVSQIIGYQDDFKPFGPDGEKLVRGVVLTMDDSKEQGLAAIIKAHGIFGGAVPLIAAGGQWTRSQVLQAVKYGVCDIVVTPASPEDIREKLRTNLARKEN